MHTPFMNVALMILAATSAVASYKGLSASVGAQDFYDLLFCALVAAAAGTAIFVFWAMALDAVTRPLQIRRRAVSWLTTFVGAAVIIGFSSFWNIVAVGGDTAQRAALDVIASQAETTLARAQEHAGAFQSAVPAISALSEEIEGLARCEAVTGCITGAPGKSGVYETLKQLQQKSAALIGSIAEADVKLQAHIDEGQACLEKLRGAVTKADHNAVSEQADCFNSALAAIQSANISDRIAAELNSFTSGVVVPLSVSSERQKQAVASILNGLADRSKAIVGTVQSSGKDNSLEPISIERMSAMWAVIVHYQQIIPSIITAIAIDLTPLLLLGFQATLTAARRERPDAKWHKYTLGDVLEIRQMGQHIKDTFDAENAPEPDTAQRVKTIQYEERELDLPPPVDEWVDINPRPDEEQGKRADTPEETSSGDGEGVSK